MVLSEYRNMYRSCADAVIDNWLEKTKSLLCNMFIETDDLQIKNGVIAALVCKCWNIFIHNFRNQPYIPIEDWYESMIEAILYVLDKHAWTNPKNVLYGNENGPEMALHRCIWSRKLNVYYLYNRPKHVINKNAYSLDELRESGTDIGYVMEEEKYLFIDYIKSVFHSGKECFAILLDLVYNGIQREKLVSEINKLDTAYIEHFSSLYGVDLQHIEELIKQLKAKKDLGDYIDYYLTCLQRDEDLIDYLRD